MSRIRLGLEAGPVSGGAPAGWRFGGWGGAVSGAGDRSDEVEALRERLSRFRDAALRVSESLDLDVVLQGVLDSARELTGGRYALIWLVDAEQVVQECLTSGLTREQSEEFLQRMPSRWEFYEFLTGIEEPVRVDDLQGYLKAHGLPEFVAPFPVSDAMAYLGAPIRHRGQLTGAVYVTEKQGGFTAEDEETLAVFASQAALAISNARRFRGEQRARADLEGLVSTAPMSVVVFDAESGAVTSANRAARLLMGDLGLPFESVYELIDSAACRRVDGELVAREALSEYLNSGETVRDEEMTIELPDGRSVALMVNATPIRSMEGAVESVVVAAQDMTALAEDDRLRAEFLGMIGHELRSPLAAIKGSATTLLQGESSLDPAEMSQFFRIIDEQADHMRELLSDLIDIVRIDTGTLAVSPAPAVLARLVEEARNTFVGMGGRENILVDFPPDLPPVLADRRRIVQVISNLLTNAARHSHQGSAIRVEAVRDKSHVAVSVADSGRGVPAERLAHLFAKFSRPDGPDQGRDLGLGLAICKGIIEAHGGRIWANSDGPGLGSRFTFTVPVSETSPPEATHRPHGAARHQTRGEPIRVLAVDDDPRALKRVRDSLTDEGYEPTVTGDPHQVPTLLEETDPHVVLLDLMLPGTDGIELMQDILAVRDTPVIFLSAYSQDKLIADALQMGAADYIIKPFSPTELAARISAALRNSRRSAAPAPAHAPEAPQTPPSAGLFEIAAMSIDHAARLVVVDGRRVELTPIEYRLLVHLAANAGTLLTHDQLLAAVWGPDQLDPGRLRSVVKNLRQKLGDNARNPHYITTVPHIGYRMPKPDTASSPASNTST